MPSKKKVTKVFLNIGELYTLKKASQKEGRRPLESDLSCIKKAAMICQGRRISWVGAQKNLKTIKDKEVVEIDMKQRVIIPAFVESHTHLVYAGHRGKEFELRQKGLSYQEIAQKGGGILSTVRATRKSSFDELLRQAQSRVDRFLEQGVTTLEVKSGYALDIKNEIKMLKVARSLKKARVISTFLGLHAVPPRYHSAENYLRFILRYLKEVKGLASRVDVFIEKGYFTPTQADLYFKKAQELGFHVVAHVNQLSPSQGVNVALKNKALSVDHAVFLSSQQIKALAASSTTAVLLPGADFYLKTPYPKARQLIEAGTRVALATDYNPGSCPSQDLNLIGFLARTEMKMSLPEVLVAYTLGGAYALALEEHLGSLEPGKLCDFIVLREGLSELFYKIGQNTAFEVWKEGQLLKKIKNL